LCTDKGDKPSNERSHHWGKGRKGVKAKGHRKTGKPNKKKEKLSNNRKEDLVWQKRGWVKDVRLRILIEN